MVFPPVFLDLQIFKTVSLSDSEPSNSAFVDWYAAPGGSGGNELGGLRGGELVVVGALLGPDGGEAAGGLGRLAELELARAIWFRELSWASCLAGTPI
jgi:hypothetical protein